MQPQVEVRSVQSSGVSAAGAFGMKAENSAHIFGILRNQLYSNKVLAVLREYSANAWDEHRAAGIPDRPIKVVLPTALEPTLRIRDYGRGLSEEDVFDVYTQYGSSTKRQSDDVVGCLGIGSKSAFAYADTFTVTSWHGGQKSIYVAVLDESNVGTMSLLWRGPCDPSETGVEVSIPVQAADCPAFRREAESLYPYFTPVPDINIPVKPADLGRSIHGAVGNYSKYQGWVAVMGCIPYALDMHQVRDELFAADLHGIYRSVGILRFDIGEVSIAASRETLEYTARTKGAIVRRAQALVDDLRQTIQDAVADDTVSPWSRRVTVMQYHDVVGNIHLGNIHRWMTYEINLYDSIRTVGDTTRTATTFEMRRMNRYYSKPPEVTTTVRVEGNARIVIRDINRSVSCYGITLDDRIIYPRTGFTVDAVRDELDACLDGVNLTGIPVVLMSTLPYTPKARNTTRTGTQTPDKKVRHFVLKPTDSFHYRGNNPSRDWAAVNRTPTDDDLFVVLDGFIPKGMDRFSYRSTVSSDIHVAEWLGTTFPPIYGYRTSAQHPVVPSACVGRHYPDARQDVLRAMMDANPERRAELEHYAWSRAQNSLGGYGRVPELRKAVQVLAADHPVRVLVERIDEAMRWEGRQTSEARRGLYVAYDKFEDIVIFEATAALRSVLDRYPHLNRNNDGPGLHGLTRPLWIDYINLIDKVNP